MLLWKLQEHRLWLIMKRVITLWILRSLHLMWRIYPVQANATLKVMTIKFDFKIIWHAIFSSALKVSNRLGFAYLDTQFSKLQTDARCGCLKPGTLVLMVLPVWIPPHLLPLPASQCQWFLGPRKCWSWRSE